MGFFLNLNCYSVLLVLWIYKYFITHIFLFFLASPSSMPTRIPTVGSDTAITVKVIQVIWLILNSTVLKKPYLHVCLDCNYFLHLSCSYLRSATFNILLPSSFSTVQLISSSSFLSIFYFLSVSMNSFFLLLPS